MSPENLTQLFRESHFTSATANMTPLEKAYLRTYINNATNLPILSAFVERLLVVAQTGQGRKLAQTTLADLDIVSEAINSMRNQTERSKQDLYLLVCHPNAGSALYNAYHKEESITAIGLKIDDPSIDKIAKEVEAGKKAAAAANKKNLNNAPRDRGAARGHYKSSPSRNSYVNREFHNNGGYYHNNSHRGYHHGSRGGRGGYNSRASYGSFQHNPATNGQGQQTGQNTFPPKPMIGWFPSQG
jgi:hypothetical protein